MIKLYGITNCDSVKKARKWLAEHHIEYAFIDFKKTPPQAEQIRQWLTTIKVAELINRRSCTWRALLPTEKQATETPNGAIALLTEKPTLIKRPLIIWANGQISTGFSEAIFTQYSQ